MFTPHVSRAAAAAVLLFASIWAAAAPGEPPAGSQPATALTDGPGPQPTAEEVLRALQGSTKNRGTVVLPDLPDGMRRESHDATASRPGWERRSGRLLPEGYRLVDRPGRMVRGADGHWMFVFEEKGEGTPEAPMRLLPCRMLEQMEAASAGGSASVVFIVSGDVTEYKAANYLLVQKLLIRPNLGNLK